MKEYKEYLHNYDFEEITLEELKQQYPFPDFPWEVAVEEDIFIQTERANSTNLIAQSLKMLKDPRIIFAPCDEEGETNPADEDLRNKIEAKYDRQIQIRTEYMKFLDDRLQEIQQPETELLDLSESKPIDKIAYLYESGIIDFLHKKDGRPHTVNSIATLLSAITGEKANTIQSAINPFINTLSSSKSKPAESTLNKAKAKIIDLGF
ncbi:hypothetical protein [Flavobacterium sp.]|uniref:hypothetical protein n=1 Tax=Flavobacterium sp. TaxID=239 RepID=UPI002C1A1666|nr:hypothetical protein [Flavobacterium sp.]HSD06963.1 hypothetical protein [Flavobacterium sp.]